MKATKLIINWEEQNIGISGVAIGVAIIIWDEDASKWCVMSWELIDNTVCFFRDMPTGDHPHTIDTIYDNSGTNIVAVIDAIVPVSFEQGETTTWLLKVVNWRPTLFWRASSPFR